MRKLKSLLVLLLFAALFLAVQNANAQVSHQVAWEHDFSVSPMEIWGINETIIDGKIMYIMNVKMDKDNNLKSLHIHNKGTFLKGESGTIYKYIDLVAQGKSWEIPLSTDYAEVHYVGHLKVIALKSGKSYSLRVNILIVFDEDGIPYFKKFMFV